MKPRIVLVLAALLAGCGGQQARQPGETTGSSEPARAGSVSPEQAKAAQLLSLTGGSATEQHTGYAGAVECAASLTLFVQSVEDSPLIDEAQADALRRAQSLFKQRARTAGIAEGKKPASIDAEITRATDDAEDDPATSSKSAIACIRQLAGEAR